MPTMARRLRSSATSTAAARAMSRRTTPLRCGGTSARASSARKSQSRAGERTRARGAPGPSHAAADEGPDIGQEDLRLGGQPEQVMAAFEDLGEVQPRVTEPVQADGPAVRLDVGGRALGGGAGEVPARSEGANVAG